MNSISSKLSKDQKEYLDFLAKKYIRLNDEQTTYIDCLLNEKQIKQGYSYLFMNTDFISLAKLPDDKINSIYKQFIDQQITLSEYSKWLSNQPKVDLGLGIPAAAAPQKEEKKEEKKAEAKKETKKEAYDIELTSFDASKKIGIIKEVRGVTNLGLKEAKELVERAPVIILKALKTDDAEIMMKKLTEAGAKITLK